MEEMRKFEVQGQEVWATEPQLTADQYVPSYRRWRPVHCRKLTHGYRIKDLEIQIGAGLIEEVIQVAENELHLVDTMEKSKPYVCPYRPCTRASADLSTQLGGSRREAR